MNIIWKSGHPLATNNTEALASLQDELMLILVDTAIERWLNTPAANDDHYTTEEQQ